MIKALKTWMVVTQETICMWVSNKKRSSPYKHVLMTWSLILMFRTIRSLTTWHQLFIKILTKKNIKLLIFRLIMKKQINRWVLRTPNLSLPLGKEERVSIVLGGGVRIGKRPRLMLIFEKVSIWNEITNYIRWLNILIKLN